MINFIIKQFFYIRFFFGHHIVSYLFPRLFHSSSFEDGQWVKDVWYYTKDYKQGYGKVVFNAKLNGLFEENTWPAMWLINNYEDKNIYYEIDIELWGKDRYPRLVFTSWVNKTNSKELECKRFNFKCQKFIKKLQSEFHEYTIKRNGKDVRLYIDGVLAGIIPYSFDVKMTIAAGNIFVKDVIVTT